MALLEVQHISKQFTNGLLIKDIHFEQNELQKIGIAGESGAGKTTLLKIISGHVQPDNGTILFDGKRVIGPDEKLLPGHKHIGYLSQHYELLNHYRVEELIWFENKLDENAAQKLFEICRIHHLLQRKTNHLSGGEKQRIALCMLLIKQPKLLVLDEPFSNLDLIHTNILKDILEDATNELKITCLLTSHDPHDTLSWADKILVMKDGGIIQHGTPEEIYYKPMNEYVAGMFGKYNLLKPQIAVLFGIDANGNDVMTRPENFKIYKTGSGVKGIITKISFQGNFYEAEVIVEDTKILVQTLLKELKPGEKVFVSVNK
jgi:ABC-type Fe3+/spermidine/putrescine transport system ATPase subunit